MPELCKSLQEHVKMHAAMRKHYCRKMQGKHEKAMTKIREEMMEKMGKNPAEASSDDSAR